MKLKLNIHRQIKIAAIIVAVAGLIAFTERMKGDVALRSVQITLENIHENHFLTQEDILDLMQLDQEKLAGQAINRIDFRAIENRIRKDPFISDAELFSDLRGNLMVHVELRRPVARIVRNDGPDGYIAGDGTIMPVSPRFTSRVVLVSGAFVRRLLEVRNLYDFKEGRALMEMIGTLQADDFWKAQIAQLDIDASGKVTLFPQVGDERIEFGRPTDLEVKFRKLKIFYKEILPRAGWNRYSRVNLEYEGQVIAE